MDHLRGTEAISYAMEERDGTLTGLSQQMTVLEKRGGAFGGLSTGAVVGIIVVASFILFATLSTLFVLYLRARDRRQRDELVAAARTRRLSGYPGGHLSVGDWSGVPQPEPAARRSNLFGYRPMSGWNGLDSEEDLNEKMSFGKRFSRHFGGGGAGDEEQSRMSWPLSSQRPVGGSIRMSKIRNKSPLSVITEVTQASNSTAPDGPVELPAMNTPPEGSPRPSDVQEESSLMGSVKHSFETTGRSSRATLELPDSTRATRASSQRSISGGKRSSNTMGMSMRGSLSPGLGQRHSPGSRPVSSIRAVSFTSQNSGIAPEGPVPSLPAEARRAGRSTSAKFSIVPDSPRNSASSGESASSSILGIDGSMAMSSPGTEITSPTPSSKRRRPDSLLLDNNARFQGHFDNGSLSPKPQHGQAQYHRQSRLRASVRGSLIRTQSTNVSRSVSAVTARQSSQESKGSLGRSKTVGTPSQARMDARKIFGPRPDPSATDPSSKRYATVESGNISRPESAQNPRPLSFDYIPRRPAPKPPVTTNITRQSSQRSTSSALRTVSGNVISSPERLSLVESSPDYDPSPQTSPVPSSPSSKPPSALSTNRSRSFRKSHKRQKSVRISTVSTYGEGSRCSPMPEEPEDQSTELIPRPLSTSQPAHEETIDRQTTDPSLLQVTPDTQNATANRTPNRTDPNDVLYSPTLSMVRFYNDMSRDNSQDTLDKRFSGATGSSVFSLPLGNWGPAYSEGSPDAGIEPISSPQSQEEGGHTPAPVMLTPTPAPLFPQRSHSKHTPLQSDSPSMDTVLSTPKSTPAPSSSQRPPLGPRVLHGPRILPSRRNQSSSPDRAPEDTEDGIITPVASNPTSPVPAESPIRDSVLLLRRMNSEVAESAINRHSARYLNMQRNPTGWKTPAVGVQTPKTDVGSVASDQIEDIEEEEPNQGGMTPWTDTVSVVDEATEPEAEAEVEPFRTASEEKYQWLELDDEESTPFQTPLQSPQRRPYDPLTTTTTPTNKASSTTGGLRLVHPSSSENSTPHSFVGPLTSPTHMHSARQQTPLRKDSLNPPPLSPVHINPYVNTSPTPAVRHSGRYPRIGAGIADPAYGEGPKTLLFTNGGSNLNPNNHAGYGNVSPTRANAGSTPMSVTGRRRKPLGPAPASASAIAKGAAPRWNASPGTSGRIGVPVTPTRDGKGVVGPKGVGLGLSMGMGEYGTPGSLYDGDGFLKEGR